MPIRTAGSGTQTTPNLVLSVNHEERQRLLVFWKAEQSFRTQAHHVLQSMSYSHHVSSNPTHGQVLWRSAGAQRCVAGAESLDQEGSWMEVGLDRK